VKEEVSFLDLERGSKRNYEGFNNASKTAGISGKTI